MLAHVQLEEFVKKLAEELSIPGELKTEVQNEYKLLFGNDLQVSIALSENDLYRLSGAIGPLPTEKTEEFVTYVAFANLLGQGTGGSVISLDNEGKLLYLSRYLQSTINYTYFKECIEMFVNYLEMWQKKREDASSQEAVYQNGILQPLCYKT